MKAKTYLFSTSPHPDAISINSLDITFFQKDINFSNYDYFILTSKQAIKALAQQSKKVLQPGLCISKATADSYEAIGGQVLEVGSGYGDGLVEKIQKYPKTTKWLYVRAKIIASDFVSKCKEDGLTIDELILYESKCSQDIEKVKVEDDATLIFTSPSSIECFLKNNRISQEAQVIVIGKTTAKSLPENIAYKIAENNTIQSCINLINSKK